MACGVVVVAAVLLVAGAVAHPVTDASASPISLSLNTSTGAYAVLVSGQPWLTSAPVRLHLDTHWLSSADGSLGLHGHTALSGEDAAGTYSEDQLEWRPRGADTSVFVTAFRQYASGAILFEQRFLENANGTAVGGKEPHESVLSEFPSFVIPDSPAAGFYQWAGYGVPANVETCAHGRWPPQWLSGGWKQPAGAMAVFTTDLADTLVMSPSHDFSVTQQIYENGSSPSATSGQPTLRFGIRGSVTSVPKGFVSGAVVQYGAKGPTETMIQWGRLLLDRAGKPHDVWRSDFSLNYLGYTTDNGGFYYYNTEPGKNYEQTILDLKAHSVAEKIPYRWILYDSWFYKKSNDTGHGMMDPAHGVINWTDADPKVFPSGLRYMYDKTGWQVVAHNRAWAKENVYAKQNGGDYDFAFSVDQSNQVIALPLTEDFWQYLVGNAHEWGCINYQQDWMFTQQGMQTVLESCTLQTEWQRQMSTALVDNNMHFGFGGTTPINWLMSVEMLAVSNGRATDDYHAGMTVQWNMGLPSVFVWALGLIPAKDGWWSTPVQTGHPYKDNRTEPWGNLHAAVAAISRGPVSPADKIGGMNRTQIMRTCMDDGTLLQPDQPALALDAEIASLAFGPGHGADGELWSTHTVINGYQFDHVLAADLKSAFTVRPADLHQSRHATKQPTEWVVFDNSDATSVSSGDLKPFGSSHPLTIPACGKSDFKLFHSAPVFSISGAALLGEVSKFVPISQNRVKRVDELGTGAVSVVLAGAPGEMVSFSVAWGSAVSTATCTVGQSSQVTVHFTQGSSPDCQPY